MSAQGPDDEDYRANIFASIEQGDREGSVKSCIGWMASGNGNVVALYEKVLSPYLNSLGSEPVTPRSIWHEHMRSSIVRTIVESSYPYVLKEKKDRVPFSKGKAIVSCLDDELHDLGARMVSDFLTLCGFDTVYLGANAPKTVIAAAVQDIKPIVVALSVTNFYNLSVAHETIGMVRESAAGSIKIVVGGRAFRQNPSACKFVGADAGLDTYNDIVNMFGGP